MAWEDRNGHRYFYLSQREGNRVRKIYVGKGAVGRAAELALDCRKELRTLPRDWLRQAADTFANVDLSDARLAVEVSAVLMARAGVQLDCRLARRILRNNKGNIVEEQCEEIILSVEGQIEASTLSMEEPATWQQLSERASRGDRDAAAALIPMLDSNPQLVDRWGDMSVVALNRWLEIVSHGELPKEALRTKVMDLVRSVRQLDDDLLEETMARRIGLLWLQVTYFDSQVALATNRTPAEQTFLAKRQKDSQQLYADATKALREYQECQGQKASARPAIFNGDSGRGEARESTGIAASPCRA